MLNFLLAALAAIGGLISLFALYLLVVALIPGMKVPPQEIEREPPPPAPAPSGPRLDLEFTVDGAKVAAWMFRRSSAPAGATWGSSSGLNAIWCARGSDCRP